MKKTIAFLMLLMCSNLLLAQNYVVMLQELEVARIDTPGDSVESFSNDKPILLQVRVSDKSFSEKDTLLFTVSKDSRELLDTLLLRDFFGDNDRLNIQISTSGVKIEKGSFIEFTDAAQLSLPFTITFKHNRSDKLITKTFNLVTPKKKEPENRTNKYTCSSYSATEDKLTIKQPLCDSIILTSDTTSEATYLKILSEYDLYSFKEKSLTTKNEIILKYKRDFNTKKDDDQTNAQSIVNTVFTTLLGTGLTDSTIFRGIENFIANSVKKELEVAFIDRFRSAITNSNVKNEFKILFPSTYNTLLYTNPSLGSGYLNSFQPAFDRDLANMIGNTTNLLYYKSDDILNQESSTAKQAYALSLIGLEMVQDLQKKHYIADMIENTAQSQALTLLKNTPTSEPIISSVNLLALLSKSLRTGYGTKWLPIEDIETLISNREAFELFIGLLLEDELTNQITINGTPIKKWLFDTTIYYGSPEQRLKIFTDELLFTVNFIKQVISKIEETSERINKENDATSKKQIYIEYLALGIDIVKNGIESHSKLSRLIIDDLITESLHFQDPSNIFEFAKAEFEEHHDRELLDSLTLLFNTYINDNTGFASEFKRIFVNINNDSKNTLVCTAPQQNLLIIATNEFTGLPAVDKIYGKNTLV